VILLLIVCVEYLVNRNTEHSFKLYRIEINRVSKELESGTSADALNLSAYETITGVYQYEDSDDSFFDSDSHYCIKDIDGRLYRIEYNIDLSKEENRLRSMTHLIAALMLIAVVFFLTVIYFTIIKNFSDISEYPSELAKGELTVPLKENKNKYFGKFLWGLNMLREKLEDEKRHNLELEKEKNVFIMSLSHDMKTPISAIRLYSQAMSKGLYKDEDKIKESAAKILENTDSIEGYVAGIISASSDDFLDLSVQAGEFYLSGVIDKLKEYYTDKL